VFILKGVKVVCFDTLLQVLILREMEAAIKRGFRETMGREEVPPPRVFSEKRLQTIENKGNECRKECKETTKRRQVNANKRVGMPEGPVEAFGTQKAHLKVCRRK
jgi:hypothetical protein